MSMAEVAFVEDIPNPGAREHYEAVATRLRLREDPPRGLIIHAAGPTDDGWRIVAVWESGEALARFRDDRLLPAIGEIEDPGRPSTIAFFSVESLVSDAPPNRGD